MTENIEMIEKYLDDFMPSFSVLLNESEEYVKDAPKVNGYFKFISIRYMKRVNDIKKLCIEYINTYIEGCLNLAKNMDDIKLVEAQDSMSKENKDNLAESLDFKKSGISTGDNEKTSNTKTGVLFLTGDKALKDKLDAIILKIKERSKKSESLTEWSNLMILQSKIQANDLVFEKTNEMIKDVKTKENRVKKLEEEKKNLERELKKVETEHKKYQKDLEVLTTQYGEPVQWFKSDKVALKDLMKYLNGIKSNDFDENPAKIENNTFLNNDDCKIGKLRSEYYKAYGMNADDLYSAIDNVTDPKLQNYLIACKAIIISDHDGSFMASPIDILLAVRNNKEAYKLFQGQKYTLVNNLNIEDFNLDIKSEDVKEQFDKLLASNSKKVKVRDEKAFATKAIYLFSRLFTKDRGLLNENKYNKIMNTKQFIVEEMIYNTMCLNDAMETMIEILSEYEDNCLYVGNIPGLDEVDYLMLYSDDNCGFFVEDGNVGRALEIGKPLNPKPVEFSEEETLSMFNIIFDVLTKDINQNYK